MLPKDNIVLSSVNGSVPKPDSFYESQELLASAAV
jgi:hypothetical protein